MQKIILTGNLGRSATVREVPREGREPGVVVSFSLAVRRGWGEREETEWYECSWWGARAEACARYLVTGKAVLVTGEPALRMWAKRDGSGWDGRITVRVDELELLGGGTGLGREAGPGGAAAPASAGLVAKEAGAKGACEALDEDVPF